MSNIPLYGHTTFCSSTHQLMGIFVLFPLFGDCNNAAMTIQTQVFACTFVSISLGYKLTSRIAGYCATAFNFGFDQQRV
jgi:hypothetical protein